MASDRIGASASPSSGTPAAAALLYRSGSELNLPIRGAECRVGFDKSNEVRVPLEGVSRRHAKIMQEGADYWLEDAGSSNGTFLNGRRVVRRERLQHLDIVTLGRRADLIFVRKEMALRRSRQIGVRTAWLEPLDGAEAGSRRELLRGSVTLGRAPSNNVVAESQLVSQIHARLERNALQLVLVDLQSSNGTFVNGEKIDMLVLNDGDIFQLGGGRSYRIHIEIGQVETSEPRPSNPDPTANRALPLDWKTRIEWTPEEKAVFDQALGRVMGSARTFHQMPVAQPTVPPPAKAPSGGVTEKPRGKLEPRVQSPASEKPAPKPAPALPAEKAASQPQIGVTPAEPAAAAAKVPGAVPAAPVPSAGTSKVTPPAPTAAPAPSSVAPGSTEQLPQDPDATRAIASLPLPAIRFSLEGENQSFSLEPGDHEVGRLPNLPLFLNGPEISRRHAVIRVTPAGATIEDLGSNNGTYVNGQRIAKATPLAGNDRVAFGQMEFRIRFEPQAEGKS